MKKIPIILTIVLLTWVFFHYLFLLSKANECTWVRVYACKKKDNNVKKITTTTQNNNTSLNKKDFMYYTNIAEFINWTYLYKLTDIKETNKNVRYTYWSWKLIIDFDKKSKKITFLKINWKTLSKKEIEKLLKSNYR